MNVALNMLLPGFENSHFPTCSLGLSVFISSVFPLLAGLEGMRFLQIATLHLAVQVITIRLTTDCVVYMQTIDAKPGG